MYEGIKSNRILVLGDTYSGKTSIMSFICKNPQKPKGSGTIGCEIQVLLQAPSSSESTPKPKAEFYELYEIGGSEPSSSANRGVVLQDKGYNGYILVYDLYNRNSLTHLSKYIQTINQIECRRDTYTPHSTHSTHSTYNGGHWGNNNYESGGDSPIEIKQDLFSFNDFNCDYETQSFNSDCHACGKRNNQDQTPFSAKVPVLLIGNKKDLVKQTTWHYYNMKQTLSNITNKLSKYYHVFNLEMVYKS